MLVNLKRNWFTPFGRFRKVNNPVEIPEVLRNKLPKGAEVVGEEKAAHSVAVPVEDEPEVVYAPKQPEVDPGVEDPVEDEPAEDEHPNAELHEADPERAAADAEEAARKKAEEFQKALADEKAASEGEAEPKRGPGRPRKN